MHSIHEGTRNSHLHAGKPYLIAQLEAVGYEWPPGTVWRGEKHPAEYWRCQPRFNGGIVSAIEVRLQRGDKIYRFAGSDTPQDRHISKCWWFDEDTCIFLWSRSGGTDHGFRNAAREAFAVIRDWSDMDRLVTGRLAHDFWAFKGVTATATGAGSTMRDRNGFDAMQLFVPGGFKAGDFNDLKLAMLMH